LAGVLLSAADHEEAEPAPVIPEVLGVQLAGAIVVLLHPLGIPAFDVEVVGEIVVDVGEFAILVRALELGRLLVEDQRPLVGWTASAYLRARLSDLAKTPYCSAK
jgi:hypothetical protein